MLVGLYKFTWLGALNISVRNSRFLCSVIGNSLMTEKSWFPRHGPRRVLRPQLPNVPATGLENAAGFHQAFWLLLGRTGFTPGMQLSRVALVMKLVPPESHADVLTTPPLCSVVMVLNCQLPTTWFTIPPWLRNFWPLPNGSVYRMEATKRCGTLKSETPFSHVLGQSAFCGEKSFPVPRIALVVSMDFDHV